MVLWLPPNDARPPGTLTDSLMGDAIELKLSSPPLSSVHVFFWTFEPRLLFLKNKKNVMANPVTIEDLNDLNYERVIAGVSTQATSEPEPATVEVVGPTTVTLSWGYGQKEVDISGREAEIREIRGDTTLVLGEFVL